MQKKSATGRAGRVLDVTKTIAYKVPWPYAGYLGTSSTYNITTVTESEKKYRGQGNKSAMNKQILLSKEKLIVMLLMCLSLGWQIIELEALHQKEMKLVESSIVEQK